jgi:hypothetical protein
MRKLAIAVLLIAVGLVLGLFLRAKRMINFPLISNDLPVTVSDGSLHVRSPRGWVSDDASEKKIRPNGKEWKDTCGLSSNGSATISLGDTDLSPKTGSGWLITLTYDDDIVTIGSDGQGLLISSARYSFDKSDDSGHTHRQHQKHDGKTTHITAIGVANALDEEIKGAFKLHFCYL